MYVCIYIYILMYIHIYIYITSYTMEVIPAFLESSPDWFRSAAAVAKAHGVHGLAQPLRGDLGHRKGGGAGQIEAGAENGMKPSRNGQVILYIIDI